MNIVLSYEERTRLYTLADTMQMRDAGQALNRAAALKRERPLDGCRYLVIDCNGEEVFWRGEKAA